MSTSLNKQAASATLHCLTGCAIGEVIGMIISAHYGFSAVLSVALSIALAFTSGYALSMLPLLKHGLSLKSALKIALIADTVSITVMELADNGFMVLIPGALNAGLADFLFWTSLSASLVVAFLAAWPVNKRLISAGKGHAYAHKYHHH